MSLAVSRHPLTLTPAPALLLQAMEEDGSAPGHPCSFLHSSNTRKGLLLLLLRYTLHVKQATTNTPASCVKERIYSARTQYSIAKKAIGSLKKNQTKQPTQQPPNFRNNHQSFQIAPHPTALTLVLLAPTWQPAASDPSPGAVPARQGTEGGPGPPQRLVPRHPAPPAEPGVPRMLPPGRDLASGLLRCYRVQLFGGDAHQRKQKVGWALTAIPGGAAAASPGLDAA